MEKKKKKNLKNHPRKKARRGGGGGGGCQGSTSAMNLSPTYTRKSISVWWTWGRVILHGWRCHVWWMGRSCLTDEESIFHISDANVNLYFIFHMRMGESWPLRCQRVEAGNWGTSLCNWVISSEWCVTGATENFCLLVLRESKRERDESFLTYERVMSQMWTRDESVMCQVWMLFQMRISRVLKIY